MYDESEKPYVLVCNEVWGGNRKVIRTVRLASLVAWVASVPINEGEGGGDLHYMSLCDHDMISRVALADVSGHGRDVNAVTQTLRKLMRKNINAWDQADFMRGLNDTFGQGGNDKYATAIVLSFHRVTGRLAFSNAGHLPPLWYHAAQRAWGWLEEGTDPQAKKVSGLPVGLIPGSDYRQSVVTLKPSSNPSDMRRADIEKLRELGWNDAAIFDAVLVTSLYACANRFSSGLGLTPDFD